MEREERFFLAALARCPGLGARRLATLLALADAKALWHMDPAELAMRASIPSSVCAALASLRREAPDLPERIACASGACGAELLVMEDSDYPLILKEIFDPPMVLYVRGTLERAARRVAVVGARRCSPYGTSLAREFGEKIAAAGLTVVSGGARGIDTAAHRGALCAPKGKTIAVLGCGIDVAYPSENRRLFDAIAERGAVISEYAPGTQPLPVFFPARNRIISGLSSGTLVVEAARRSGSLITAELALSEGRDVYAVPGSVLSPTSEGCHALIAQGAKLTARPGDILEDFGLGTKAPRGARKSLSSEERKIYQVLSFDHPLTMDEILMSLPDGEIANLAFLLLQMELKGLVIENEWHAYRRAERE